MIKEVTMDYELQYSEIQREVSANNVFKDSPGLIRVYCWRNSYGERELRADEYPLKIYLILEKGKAFTRHRWQDR